MRTDGFRWTDSRDGFKGRIQGTDSRDGFKGRIQGTDSDERVALLILYLSLFVYSASFVAFTLSLELILHSKSSVTSMDNLGGQFGRTAWADSLDVLIRAGTDTDHN